MTEQEAMEFLRDVAYVAFPDARKFVQMNSKDPAATARMQSKALLDLDYAECVSVIDRWLAGKLPAPFGGEIEQFALHLRATVLQDRTTKARSRPLDEIRRIDRGSSSRIPCMPYVARILDLGPLVKNGEMTREQFDVKVKEMLEAFERDYKASQRKPGGKRIEGAGAVGSADDANKELQEFVL